MDIATIGVEEEFLLVEPDGRPRPLIEHVLAGFGDAEHELMQEQAEIASTPHRDLATLQVDLAGRRRALAQAVRESGGQLCALGTSPFPAAGTTTPDERYERMIREYGITAQEQLACGCHVHVSVESRAAGVAALNGIQPWLPVLIALGANSPFHQGIDTGYASYRRMLWSRWPSSGAVEAFSDADAYASSVRALVEAGVVLDEGMIYFDARLSRTYPTVEIRVCDVQLEAADAVLLAALCRGLVTTALARSPDPLPRAELVRGAAWRAARSGMSGDLADVLDRRAVPAWSLVERLTGHVSAALKRTGDLDDVEASLHRIHQRGTGADVQRAAFARHGDLTDVVTEAVELTSPA